MYQAITLATTASLFFFSGFTLVSVPSIGITLITLVLVKGLSVPPFSIFGLRLRLCLFCVWFAFV